MDRLGNVWALLDQCQKFVGKVLWVRRRESNAQIGTNAGYSVFSRLVYSEKIFIFINIIVLLVQQIGEPQTALAWFVDGPETSRGHHRHWRGRERRRVKAQRHVSIAVDVLAQNGHFLYSGFVQFSDLVDNRTHWSFLTVRPVTSTGKTYRDRSRPRVKGTTQKLHILSQPRMTETYALSLSWLSRTGVMSAYVSSNERTTLTLG